MGIFHGSEVPFECLLMINQVNSLDVITNAINVYCELSFNTPTRNKLKAKIVAGVEEFDELLDLVKHGESYLKKHSFTN